VTDHQFSVSHGHFPPGADALVGRQSNRASEQGGRGGQCAAVPGAVGGILQISRQGLIGLGGGSGTVPHLHVRITVPAAGSCEPVMRAPAVGLAYPVIDGRPNERMPESH